MPGALRGKRHILDGYGEPLAIIVDLAGLGLEIDPLERQPGFIVLGACGQRHSKGRCNQTTAGLPDDPRQCFHSLPLCTALLRSGRFDCLHLLHPRMHRAVHLFLFDDDHRVMNVKARKRTLHGREPQALAMIPVVHVIHHAP